jgi:hypothetical protein
MLPENEVDTNSEVDSSPTHFHSQLQLCPKNRQAKIGHPAKSMADGVLWPGDSDDFVAEWSRVLQLLMQFVDRTQV